MTSLNRKRIFISGGAGVIGREIVKRLIEKDAIVMVGDLLPIPHDFPQEILYRQGDLNFIDQQELDSFNPEIFIHLAATFERSVESYDHWEENFWHNIRLSNHLMTLVRNVPEIRRVVFASSYLIYNKDLYNFSKPQEKSVKLKENDVILPRNLTGMAKLTHEVELDFFSNFKSDKFTSISARIFRGYGKGSKDVISRWIRDALDGETITVYNSKGIFDYIYAGDTAEGLIRLSKINDSGVVNLGTGRSRRVEDIVSILKQYFPELNVQYTKPDLNYESSESDTTKLLNMLDWLPKYDLEDTIPKIIEYEKSHVGSNEKYNNVFITSISKKAPLIQAVIRAVQKINPTIKVFGGDVDASCIGKHIVNEFWLMPRLEDLTKDILIEFCNKNNIGLIIPTRDGELEYFSSIKSQLKNENIDIMISELDSIRICLDKLKFSQLQNVHAIPASENIGDIDSNRYAVKERVGAGSDMIGLDLEKNNALEHSKALDNAIFQPFISGDEISVDAYVSREGNVKGIVMRRRDTVINGESQVTTTFSNDELEKSFKIIISSLNLYGHVILQALITNSGGIHVIECNPRFGGASTLSLRAGLDSFYWAYLESMKVSIKDYPFIRSQKELTQVRYPQDFYL